MALRDDLRRRFGYVENPRTIGSQWMSDTAERYADDVLDLLRDPAHRDELLAMLLGPDESVRKDGEAERACRLVYEAWQAENEFLSRPGLAGKAETEAYAEKAREAAHAVMRVVVPASGTERSGKDEHGR